MSSASNNRTGATAPAPMTAYNMLHTSFSAGPPFEEMARLDTHNDLLGNRAALDEVMERDGYWFFRDVLDKGVVGRVRNRFIQELEREGMAKVPRGGESAARVPFLGDDPAKCSQTLGALNKDQVWQDFVAEKPIHDFFKTLLQDEPFWFPSVSYRSIPPLKDAGAGSRYAGIHADSTANPGVPFKTVWVPLSEIDADIGGLILARGMTGMITQKNRKTIMNDMEAFVNVEDIPAEAWRRSEFQPGDVLLMHCSTPHCGVSNISDSFRLSMDMRVLGASENVPVLGEIVTISPEEVTVRAPAGDVTLKIDADTYVRNPGADRLLGDDIAAFYKAGTGVIVGRRGDTATLIRLPTY